MAVPLSLGGDARSHGSVAPLRLLWLIDSLTVGGAESLAVTFAKALKGRHVELTVCSRASICGNPLEAEIRGAGIEVESLGARKLLDVAAFRRLVRIVRERRIEVVHAHLSYAAIWGALVSRLTGVRLIATLHVPPVAVGVKERMRQKLLTVLLNRYAARTVLVSAALRNAWRGHIRHLDVIHNGIEIPPVVPPDASVRRELGLEPDALVVVTVAVLREGKGIDVLLRAAAVILRHEPRVRFVVVGDGPMRERWSEMATELDAPVTWTGYRPDVRRILSACDLFVLPTLTDAFPTVLLEAMSACLPVVASDTGGVPEIVDAPSTGLLVPPGDVTLLAEAIVRALDDETWRRAAGAAGRARVESLFSTERSVNALEALYAEVRTP